MDFNQANQLTGTDYFTASDGRLAERTWLAVRGGVWHVLMPTVRVQARRLDRMVALPVTARRETCGWQWALVTAQKDVNLRISLDSIIGNPPPLPQPGARLKRQMLVYGNPRTEMGPVQYNFGHFEHGAMPVLLSCDLDVVRPRRGKDGLRFAGITLPLR